MNGETTDNNKIMSVRKDHPDLNPESYLATSGMQAQYIINVTVTHFIHI
jgi:hypothetical protein